MIEELVDKIARKETGVVFPHTLSRKGLYILPTRPGLLFILVLFVMLAGSINYSNNLGFLFTFLLGSMVFISILHTHRNLLGLTIRSAAVQPVFAGDDGLLKLLLQTEERSRPGICFDVKINEATIQVTTNDNRRVSVPLPTEMRGFYKVTSITVSSSYPFGLFRTWSTFYPNLGYLVYPAALGGEFNPSATTDGSETQGSRETDGVDDFKGLQPYRPGDPMSRLSWKSLARGKGLHTKEFSAHIGESVMIAWDDVSLKETEKKLSRLCDMVLKAHDMNLSYGLSIPGTLIPKGEPKDKAHRHLCLKALALYGKGGVRAEGKRP